MTSILNDNEPTLPLVFNQLQDVVVIQKQLMDSLCSEVQTMKRAEQSEGDRIQQELEDERREHEKTKALLSSESDKLQFALGEIEILTAQLSREKKLFETSFGRISERVKKESSKTHQLQTECTSIKAEKEKQEEILVFKDSKISNLKKRLANQKENHQRHLEEISIQKQQEAYINRNLATNQRKERNQRNSSLR